MFCLTYLADLDDEFDSCVGLSGEMDGLAMSVKMSCRKSWVNELILLGLSG